VCRYFQIVQEPLNPVLSARQFENTIILELEKLRHMTAKKIKILIGKPGLDGHDRGAKVIALALRDAGMEVIYTGLHQTIEEIVRIAVQESVDVLGLSIMSGAHLPISKTLLDLMKTQGIEDIPVAIGGVIPKQDIAKLKTLGIQGVFPGGTSFAAIIAGIEDIAN
jgi:methylmalonyl-CoA mutase C-terminal domain/subunit